MNSDTSATQTNRENAFGWCFIGSGAIARRVLADFPYMDGAYVASVYSRDIEKANAFASLCGAKAYDSLEAALAAPGVRAAYMATTNDMHYAHTMAALNAGVPVLCEKPFSVNLQEAERMIETAQKAKLFLMEGMWIRFSPAIQKAIEWLRAGRIGQPLTMQASFAFRVEDPSPRLTDPALGGGSLLDVGVYPISLAQFVYGRSPEKIAALLLPGPAGADMQCAAAFQYENGATAQLFAGFNVFTPHDAVICGSGGQIRIPDFWHATTMTLHTPSGVETFAFDRQGEGFQYQFDAVMKDIRAGLTQNALVNHAHTLSVMETLQRVREAAARV